MSFTYRKDTLDNGIRVITESNKEFGSTALGFWLGVGSSCEPAPIAGVSHFIEHIVFKGTRKRTAYQIAHALESVGGSIDAYAGKEATTFVSRCLPEHLPRAVDVISDMVCNPLMARDAIALEKQVIFEEIRSFEDSPEDVVHELFARSVWHSGPLGNPILGTAQSVGDLSRDAILAYFRSSYISPNVIVVATGKVDHDALVDLVERKISLPYGDSLPEPTTGPWGIPNLHHEKRKVSQCYICLGTRAMPYTDDRRFAATVLAMVTGGGMTSRLFQEVRERRGLAYSVYCAAEFLKSTGMLLVFLAVDPAKARKAVRRVARELKRVKAEGISLDELRSTKEQLKGHLVLGLESASARMSRVARHEFYLGRYQPFEETLARVKGVRRDAVMREARTLLDPDDFSLVVAGPPSMEFPTLEDLDF